MALRTVHLHGEAGRLFGRKWELDVENLAEAVRAIGVQAKGFQVYIEARNFQCVRGKTAKGGQQLSEGMIEMRLGSADLHIVPVLRGAGGKGAAVGKIIAGILLAGFAFFAAPALMGLGLSATTVKTIGMLGIGLALQGVSSLLSPQSKKKDAVDDSSKLFQGIPNNSEQGIPIPLIVGRMRLQGMPIISTRIITARV